MQSFWKQMLQLLELLQPEIQTGYLNTSFLVFTQNNCTYLTLVCLKAICVQTDVLMTSGYLFAFNKHRKDILFH